MARPPNPNENVWDLLSTFIGGQINLARLSWHFSFTPRISSRASSPYHSNPPVISFHLPILRLSRYKWLKSTWMTIKEKSWIPPKTYCWAIERRINWHSPIPNKYQRRRNSTHNYYHSSLETNYRTAHLWCKVSMDSMSFHGDQEERNFILIFVVTPPEQPPRRTVKYI